MEMIALGRSTAVPFVRMMVVLAHVALGLADDRADMCCNAVFS